VHQVGFYYTDVSRCTMNKHKIHKKTDLNILKFSDTKVKYVLLLKTSFTFHRRSIEQNLLLTFPYLVAASRNSDFDPPKILN
jgi:hypothetical protein